MGINCAGRLAYSHGRVLLAVLSLAGCTGHGTALTSASSPPMLGGAAKALAKPANKVAIAPVDVLPLPMAATRALIAIASPASLSGSVQLQAVTSPYFGDSAAPFGLLAVAAGNALLNVSSLEEDLYTKNGTVVTGATALDGSFTLTNGVPGDRPYVLQARLAGDHRLTGIVTAGSATTLLDEASTMVVEMARWQLLPFTDPNYPNLTNLTAATVQQLHDATAIVMSGADLAVTAGTAPSIEALKTGAGHLLRNIYVAEFGSKVTAAGTPSTPVQANTLSDMWEAILGFKPLALTVAAGTGQRTTSQEEGKLAENANLVTPSDAVEDAQGNLFILDREAYTIQLVPRTTLAGPYLQSTGDLGSHQLSAGHIYTIAGLLNGTRNSPDYNTDFDAAAAADPVASAPAIAPPNGFALLAPNRLLLEAGAVNPTRSHLIFSSGFDARLFFIASEDATRFGITMKAGHIYPIAGTGISYGTFVSNGGATTSDDGAAAVNANLGFPTAIQRDNAGNIYVLDAGPIGKGELRVIRQSDDKIFTLGATLSGNPLSLQNASDLRLSPNGQWLYFALADTHVVFKIPAPTPAAITLMAATPAKQVATRVMGNPGKAGFIDTSIPGLLYPDIHQLAAPIAESITAGGVTTIQCLLNTPSALEFTPAGDLIVADLNRVRLLRGGQVYNLGGGFATNFVSGDSRLCFYQNTSALSWSAFEGNLLLTDSRLNRIRRMWTARGIIHTGN